MSISLDSFSWEVVLTIIGALIVLVWRASSERQKIEGCIDTIRGDFNTLRAEVKALKSNQVDLDKDHDETKRWRDSMTERVDAHDRRLDNIDTRHKLIYGKIDDESTAVGMRMDAIVESNHKETVTIIGKLGAIEGKLDAISNGRHRE